MDVTADQGRLTPSWDNGVVRLYHADARSIPLPDESVHCVVTSPPYWNLRDYGLAPSVWGGDPECPHYWSDGVVAPGARSSDSKSGSKQRNANRRDRVPTSACCGECGAWRGALGLETTVNLYVSHIVEIFREVWRVLRKDGTVWLNLGDSYAASPKGNLNGQDKSTLTSTRTQKHSPAGISKLGNGLKPKDLMGMPWRVAFALQDDGWWLRSDIIWSKLNPMPESVQDRPTRAHEYVFLLSKSARYYCDMQAIRESKGNGWHGNKFAARAPERHPGENRIVPPEEQKHGANARSVWTISTRGYPGSHFATFPEELPRRCILVGTSEHGVCSECGAPRQRVVEKTASTMNIRVRDASKGVLQHKSGYDGRANATKAEVEAYGPERPGVARTLDWQPTCACDVGFVPATVLDPFVGSGTTAVAAQKLGRRAVGLDASSDYLQLAIERVGSVPLPLPFETGLGGET